MLLSRTVKVTVGFCPAPPLVTDTKVKFKPVMVFDWSGTVCAPMMEASNSPASCGIWHCVHWLSSVCGRFTWFAPVAKLTLSWQEPHAARVGVVSHALVCAAPFLGLWQVPAQSSGS